MDIVEQVPQKHEAVLDEEVLDEDQASEGLLEETMVQDLVDDMAKDEGSSENEYDHDARNEHQEALVEEIKEHEEMVSSPYPHVAISYDILGSLKMMIIGSSWLHQYMILQD